MRNNDVNNDEYARVLINYLKRKEEVGHKEAIIEVKDINAMFNHMVSCGDHQNLITEDDCLSVLCDIELHA
jgi:hypothetical protein